MKKILATILAITMLGSFALAGCGDTNDAADGDTKADKICLIVGNLGDKSFNDIAWEGMQKFGKDTGAQVKVVEYGTDKSKIQPMLLDACDSYDVIVSSGNEVLEFLADGIAEDYADKNFVCFDIAPDYEVKNDNVFCINYKQFEGDFLAAYVAMKMSKTGNIGFIGGGEITVILDFMTGYIDGALYANPNGKVAVSFVGNFTDSAKAKELALVQIEQNKIDVIHQVAAGAGLGVFEAVKEKGNAWAIGVDADQREYFTTSNPELADVILTSMLKRNDIALYDILQKTADGTAAYGTLARWGAAEGVTVLVDNDFFKASVGETLYAEYKELLGKVGELDLHSAYYMEQSEINALRNSVKP